MNKRVLNRVPRLENLVQFLKSAVLSLGHHEVKHSRLDRIPNNKDDVSLPLDVSQSDRPSELVEHAARVDRQGRKGHSFRAHLEREHFDRVQCLQRRDSERVDGAEDEDHGDRGFGRALVCFAGLAKEGGRGRHADPDDARADHGEEHEGAAADAVDEGGACECEDELEASVAEVDVGLGHLLCVAGGVEHGGEEVGEHLRRSALRIEGGQHWTYAVSGPLREDGEDNVGREAVSACARVEERTVVPPALVGTLHVKVRFILFQLQLDPRGISVAIAMVFCEHSDGLFAFVVDVEPARGFRDEPGENHNQTREEHLKVDGDRPARITLERDGTANRSRGKNRTGEPETVAVGGDDATEGRVSGLNHVDWASRGDDRDAETEYEATGLELSKASIQSGGAVDDGSDDDDPGSDLHAHFSTPSVGRGTHEEESADTTNLVHGGVDGGPGTIVGSVEEVQEFFVGRETTKYGTVEAVL